MRVHGLQIHVLRDAICPDGESSFLERAFKYPAANPFLTKLLKEFDLERTCSLATEES